MGVEAARLCLKSCDTSPDVVRFASTTSPFADRASAVLLSEALNLGENIRCADIGGFLGAGIGALIDVLDREGRSLVVASDRRRGLPGSMQEMTFGHGAAAVMTGVENPIARCLATHATAEDFVDHYRSAGAETDYALEERWVRDEGQLKIVPPAIATILAKADCALDDIDQVILSGVGGTAARQVAKVCGIADDRLVDTLGSACGDTGTAHPLLILAETIERVGPGRKILAVHFAQGVQCVLMETTQTLAHWRSAAPVQAQLDNGEVEENYVRFLSFEEQVSIDWGVRAERDNRTAMSAFNRHRKTVTGFIGGSCTRCGNRQFPKGQACVNPQCRSFDTLVDEPFSDKIGTVKSFTEDWLAISSNPPLMYGNVTFDDGGVVMMEFTDFSPGELRVGQPVRFVFRIKDKDPKRDFRRYFWKAVPAEAAEMG